MSNTESSFWKQMVLDDECEASQEHTLQLSSSRGAGSAPHGNFSHHKIRSAPQSRQGHFRLSFSFKDSITNIFSPIFIHSNRSVDCHTPHSSVFHGFATCLSIAMKRRADPRLSPPREALQRRIITEPPTLHRLQASDQVFSLPPVTLSPDSICSIPDDLDSQRVWRLQPRPQNKAAVCLTQPNWRDVFLPILSPDEELVAMDDGRHWCAPPPPPMRPRALRG